MRANENATEAGKKAIQAVNLEDEERPLDRLNPLQKAKSIASKRGRINEHEEEKYAQTESWHCFKTP